MNMVFCCWGSLMESGILNAFQTLGIPCVKFHRDLTDYDTDTAYLNALSDFLLAHNDATAVFSINYVPLIAMACKAHKLPYISWTVDCPCLTLYSDTVTYPTNYIFLFDRVQAEKLYDQNPGHVFHLPLAFDPAVAQNMQLSAEDHKQYDCDVSFVGSLYTQKNQYDAVRDALPAYMRGYAEGLIASQINVYGYNLIADSISDKWAGEFLQHAKFQVFDNYRKDYKSFISDYFIGYKCTQLERIRIMQEISKLAKADLYTTSDTKPYPEINNRGIADSTRVMPKVFACSKINLNITLRSITSGIPLRCFDIMGMGGFLLSNYQPELAEYFVNGEEMVMYESIPDLLDKVQYYLSHDEERSAIAANGQKKVLSEFSFEHQISTIFQMFS